MDDTTPTSAAPASDTAVLEVLEVIEPQLLDDELLVEEISIDGMCGVY